MDPSFWNERFGADAYAYGTEPNDFVREEAHRIPRGRVLCIAEGEGRNAVYLAGLGHTVTAVDFSEKGLEKAARLAKERGVTLELVQANLADYLPPEGAFTGVVATFAHLLPDIRKRVHGLVPGALVPGGCFVLEAYTPAQLTSGGVGGPKDPAMLMTLAGLRDELAPLDFVVGREVTRNIDEGPFHGGPSATVQVVAVKR